MSTAKEDRKKMIEEQKEALAAEQAKEEQRLAKDAQEFSKLTPLQVSHTTSHTYNAPTHHHEPARRA